MRKRRDGTSEAIAPTRTRYGVKQEALRSAIEVRERSDTHTTSAKKYASRAERWRNGGVLFTCSGGMVVARCGE